VGPTLEAWIDAGRKAADAAFAQRTSFSQFAGKRKGLLIAEGDSWFDYPGDDILKILEDKHGWEVRSVAHYGDDLEDMAYNPNQLDSLLRSIEWAKFHDQEPVAILLSGGGNDIAGPEFKALLDHAKSAEPGINDAILDEIVSSRLKNSYVYLIASVNRVSQLHFGRDLPILLHGYDYPVPDGRGFAGGWGILPGPWLKPTFFAKGFYEQAENIVTMSAIIDRFDSMLADLVQVPGFADFLHFVDLRGTLPTSASLYQDWWANEMHPTPAGFRAIAQKFAATLEELVVPNP